MTQQKSIKATAYRILARRDHSEAELRQKLLEREFPPEVVKDCLLELKAQGYLNDRRYADLLVRQGLARGDGPLKIQRKLALKKISETESYEALAQAQKNWQSGLIGVINKRYGASSPRNQKEKLQRLRFLQSRGFETQQILRVLKEFDE